MIVRRGDYDANLVCQRFRPLLQFLVTLDFDDFGPCCRCYQVFAGIVVFDGDVIGTSTKHFSQFIEFVGIMFHLEIEFMEQQINFDVNIMLQPRKRIIVGVYCEVATLEESFHSPCQGQALLFVYVVTTLNFALHKQRPSGGRRRKTQIISARSLSSR